MGRRKETYINAERDKFPFWGRPWAGHVVRLRVIALLQRDNADPVSLVQKTYERELFTLSSS